METEGFVGSNKTPNPALNLAPFGRWTLRDKAAQRRLALLQGLPQIRKRNESKGSASHLFLLKN
jgi:hypothetical protein